MTTRHPTYCRLQALLGDALPGLQLPNATAEALEDALSDAAEAPPVPPFFAHLQRSAQATMADGQPWTGLRLSAARARDLASTTRCLAALSALAGVLLVAQAARELDGPHAQCPPQTEEGLLQAVQVLAEHAGALMVPAPV